MRLNWARTARRRAKLGKHAGSGSRRRWTNKLALGAGSRVRTAAAEGEGTRRQPGLLGAAGTQKWPDYLETTPEGWRFAAQPRRKD